MSAISGYISQIQNAVYGEQVRSAIVSALEACYSDVENPNLQSAAFLEAINEAYDSGILDITEVTLVSQMTNENIIYRYMGSETGYYANTLYFYNGTAWVPIGSYNVFDTSNDGLVPSPTSQEAEDNYFLSGSGNWIELDPTVDALKDTTVTNGYIVDEATGEIISNSYTIGYAVTDYIPLSFGDSVSLAFVRGKNLCGGAFYDSEKNFLFAINGTDDFSVAYEDIAAGFSFIVTDKRIAFMRYNIVANTLFPKANQFVKIKHDPTFVMPSFPVIHCGTGCQFTKIKDMLEYINDYNVKNAVVFLHAKTYDLVSEFGQSYLDSLVVSSNKGTGMFIGNNTKIIFEDGAKIVFDYQGSNDSVITYFSPFNVRGSFELDNADIEVSNCRYCVHEDLPTSSDILAPYIAKYNNCKMNHKGNTGGTYRETAAIGAGTYKNSLSIIEGGEYYSDQYQSAVTYHNFDGTETSKLIVKNAYIDNSLRLYSFRASPVDVVVSGCKIPNGITYDGSSNRFNVTEWNNSTL